MKIEDNKQYFIDQPGIWVSGREYKRRIAYFEAYEKLQARENTPPSLRPAKKYYAREIAIVKRYKPEIDYQELYGLRNRGFHNDSKKDLKEIAELLQGKESKLNDTTPYTLRRIVDALSTIKNKKRNKGYDTVKNIIIERLYNKDMGITFQGAWGTTYISKDMAKEANGIFDRWNIPEEMYPAIYGSDVV